MFRKRVKYEDEKRPLPVMWTVVIAIAVIVGLYVGACYLTGIAEKRDMIEQYNY